MFKILRTVFSNFLTDHVNMYKDVQSVKRASTSIRDDQDTCSFSHTD